ncbi:MAG: YraN family protein [Acidimicrobiia bacterium]|nr:YraN family protein [Acidimicrobiia bacterium]
MTPRSNRIRPSNRFARPAHAGRTSRIGRSGRLGQRGEDIAAAYLISRGCTILERNVRVGADEIDLVVAEGAAVAAVEVKTSTNGDDPLEAVDDAKFARIERAVVGLEWRINRIDLVGVAAERRGVTIRWLRAVR